MIHPIYRVVAFQIEAPRTLRVRFDDATEQVIEFEPILRGEVYGPLRDSALFRQVKIDPDVHTLVWDRFRTCEITGNRMPAITAIMPVTTSNSTIVNAVRRKIFCFISICPAFLISL